MHTHTDFTAHNTVKQNMLLYMVTALLASCADRHESNDAYYSKLNESPVARTSFSDTLFESPANP